MARSSVWGLDADQLHPKLGNGVGGDDPRDAVAAVGEVRTDAARIARALEVILSTGRTLQEWQTQREGGIADEVELRPLILLPPRGMCWQSRVAHALAVADSAQECRSILDAAEKAITMEPAAAGAGR